MKQAYLKWYYGYKNFGDELLFFGVIDRIFSKYPEIQNLVIEAGNKARMEERIAINHHKHISSDIYKKISIVEIRQHRRKRQTHFLNIFGFGAYRKHFKFFGGWEVLSDERSFPHDWWNLPILFSSTIFQKRFMILWWIGTTRKRRSKLLYKWLLPRAKWIVLRDQTSYKTALKYNRFSTIYQDFSEDTIKNNQSKQSKNSDSFVLINCNLKARNSKTQEQIVDFCQKHKSHKKIFFPCDMNDDIFCFKELKTLVPDMEIYDWTNRPLSESLNLFNHSIDAIWARLHFLLPLKIYNKRFTSIRYAEKIYKMIW